MSISNLPNDCFFEVIKQLPLRDCVSLSSADKELQRRVNEFASMVFDKMDGYMASWHGADWQVRFGVQGINSVLEKISETSWLLFGCELNLDELYYDYFYEYQKKTDLEAHIGRFKKTAKLKSWSHDVAHIRNVLQTVDAERKQQLLVSAIYANYWEFIPLFKQAGGDINSVDIVLYNLFDDWFSHEGRAPIVVALSKAGFDFSKNGWSYLRDAVRAGRYATVRALISSGISPIHPTDPSLSFDSLNRDGEYNERLEGRDDTFAAVEREERLISQAIIRADFE